MQQDLKKDAFSALCASIADQALRSLNEDHSENKETVRFTITLLEVLEEKTKGNLTDTEKDFLSKLIQDLRLRYVQNRNT